MAIITTPLLIGSTVYPTVKHLSYAETSLLTITSVTTAYALGIVASSAIFPLVAGIAAGYVITEYMSDSIIDSCAPSIIRNDATYRTVATIATPPAVLVTADVTLKKVPQITGKINSFVNFKEVFMMASINTVLERILKHVELPSDPMIKTMVSDTSSTFKTGVAWQTGLKKGTVPYTGYKTLAAGMKAGIKIAPHALARTNITDPEKLDYQAVTVSYLADFPSTLISEAEKLSYKQGTTLSSSFATGSVWTISASSSCFKTLGSSFGATVSGHFQSYVITPPLSLLALNMQKHIPNDVTDFGLYMTLNSLPKCVKQYLSFKINHGINLELSEAETGNIEDSLSDMKYLKKTKEDKFCYHLRYDASTNAHDMDVVTYSEIRKQSISPEFFHSLPAETKADIVRHYGQFASITEFGKGAKLSLSLLDYPIKFSKSFFISNTEYLPPISNTREATQLLTADLVNFARELGNTYVFAGSVRAITSVVGIYTEYFKGSNLIVKQLPLLAGGSYLTYDVAGKISKINGQHKAQEQKKEADKKIQELSVL